MKKTCHTLARFFDFARWIIVVLAAVITLLSVLTIINPALVGRPELSIPVSFRVDDAGVTIERAIGYLQVPVEGIGSVAALWGGIMVLLGLCFLVARYMRDVFRSAAEGRAFDPRNRVRFTALGVAVIVYGILTHVYYAMAVVMLQPAFTGNVAAPTFDLRLGFLLAGFMVIALGEIFREGQALQEDRDLTV